MDEDTKDWHQIDFVVTRRLTNDEYSKLNDIIFEHVNNLPDCKWEMGSMDKWESHALKEADKMKE